MGHDRNNLGSTYIRNECATHGTTTIIYSDFLNNLRRKGVFRDSRTIRTLETLPDSPTKRPEGSKEQLSREGGDEPERTPVAEPIPQEMAREEIDLNETAKKQGIMTDDEFQMILDEVNRKEDDTFMLVEDLGLASRTVGEGEVSGTGNEPEGQAHQPVDEVEERQTREEETMSVTPQPDAGESEARIENEETVTRTEVPAPVAPPVSKLEAVKRKLVLKSDPKAERPKPTRVSQRCLRKWTSSKVKANTTADPVEVLSEEERTTPTKPGEESLSATDLEDASTAAEVVSPTPSDQREGTDKMAEGLDLASESVGHKEPRDDNIHTRVETHPTAQDKPSTQAEKKPEEDEERDEDKYREERKRKGKAPVKKKPGSKKQRTVNIDVVIKEPDQRASPHRRESSDNEYTASEESGSESDISLEEEEHST
ncbi:muscle M-line assembly protein unc-89-like [Salvia splendens]|uniref:muscle M-line assembly protein unc-89-like n=1 Tax=Salvia splendens TaxID=180675 RepID=UPI001C25D438|nr:muscle M-line assembly protein unc-89-like [Salvia splendens]